MKRIVAGLSLLRLYEHERTVIGHKEPYLVIYWYMKDQGRVEAVKTSTKVTVTEGVAGSAQSFQAGLKNQAADGNAAQVAVNTEHAGHDNFKAEVMELWKMGLLMIRYFKSKKRHLLHLIGTHLKTTSFLVRTVTRNFQQILF